ncbi:hypothetical protein K1719_039355 [Acacia pycnantha]|nr:hypothetical protein K1719_039355 [Acacia pycnantha]
MISSSIPSFTSASGRQRRISLLDHSDHSLPALFSGLTKYSWFPSQNLSSLDPPDEKVNVALLLSRRTYPPRDSWNFCGLPPPFGYAGTTSPLTTNQRTSSGWVLPASGRSEQQGTPRRRFYSWAAVSRSRGRSAPCPRIWVICSNKFLLQSDLAGERSQFAAENKTASERTFVRFFSTKHGSLRITVGHYKSECPQLKGNDKEKKKKFNQFKKKAYVSSILGDGSSEEESEEEEETANVCLVAEEEKPDNNDDEMIQRATIVMKTSRANSVKKEVNFGAKVGCTILDLFWTRIL